QYTVTATADANGTIDPASRLVNHGEATSFTLQPNSGYRVATVTGCNGSRSGSTYTTGAITANCTVEATFAETAIAGSVTATIVNDEDAFFDPGSLGVIPLTGHPNSPAIAPPADLDFPAGLFDFKAEHNTAGGTLTLRLEYQDPLPEYSVYWIFGPTTEGGAAEWYPLAPEQFSLSEDR
ncbi:choice-of-anchor U domain-containing protein, partial [Arthrospira platensis SPKY1]|nr:choice-of-anchor U domain-containing protein [Arthrospira platensis SPKY1]